MLRRAYYKRTKKGGIIKVVSEHYLRDDVGCGLSLCSSCQSCLTVGVLRLESSLRKKQQQVHVLVIDTNVVLHDTDMLEEDFFRNVVVPQTVYEEVKHRSPPAYKRIRDMLANTEKHFYLFHNEFHHDTYVQQQEGESINDRNDRAIRVAAKWYLTHLAKIRINLILISNDMENKRKAVNDGIEALSMREYVEKYLLLSRPELTDKLSGVSEDVRLHEATSTVGSVLFAEHKSASELTTGLKAGTYKQGNIQISRDNYLEAFVFVDGEDEPVFVQGLLNCNRAVHNDTVVIEMLPNDHWTVPAAVLKRHELDVEQDLGDELAENEDEEMRTGVLQSRKAKRRKQDVLPTGRVIGIIKRNWRPYCGVLQSSPVSGATRHLFLPAERRVPRIRIETKQADRLQGQRIMVAIDSWPRNSRYPRGHFVRLLGPLGDRQTENEVLLLEHDIPHHTFSEAVLDCLPKLPWFITNEDIKARDDLRHLTICSVDPPGCTDIDDALHCRRLPNGRMEVGVHIADVTHFLRHHTAMDDEAADRGTTVYLVDQRIDMLPELLSSNLCSLRGGEERFAFSVLWELTEGAEILSVRFCKSIIRSRAALTYADAQAIIWDAARNDAVAKSLRDLNTLAKRLKAKRHAAGALTLASLEIRFNVDSETHDPIDVQVKESLETNSMVEEFMLLANISVAERIYQEFPDCALLRRHPVPPVSNYKPLLTAAAQRGFKLSVDSGKALSQSLDQAVIPDNPYFNTMLRMLTTRCMTQAVYFASGTLEQSQYLHFGLAAAIYTHFTSPIRRYADVMVHRLLAAAIHADDTYPELLSKQKTQQLCQNLNHRHKMAQYAGRASVLLNTHLFFKNRVEVLVGYIIGVRKNALQILVPKYGLESVVVLNAGCPLSFNEDDLSLSSTDGTVLRMFDVVKVQVTVDTTDVQHEKLKLHLVEPIIEGLSVQLRSDEVLQRPQEKKARLS